MKPTITLLILLLSASCFSQNIAGKWSGIIKTGQSEPLVFIFDFEKTGETYATVISIPAKRISGLKPKETTFTGGELLVDGSNLGFKYQGNYLPDSQQIAGTFTEGVNTLHLTLKKADLKTENAVKRQQEPVRPYPYKEEEVTFSNKKAGVTISGTLTLPNKTGLSPVVVLISGSGPQDRDETFFGHKPFLVLADYLTTQGIAVLRCDDRGVGKSTGDHSMATTKDLASDVVSAVDYLKSRTDIDRNKIGLIGHSEGGIIAPMVAHYDKTISFIVLLGATGIPGSEASLYLAKTTRGFPVQDEAVYDAAISKAIKISSSNKDLPEIKTELRAHYQLAIAPMIRAMFNSDKEVEDIITKMIEMRTSPWNRYFYTYNPANELEKVSCPVLALNGSKDKQVQPQINQQGIRNALEKGRNKDYMVKEIPNLNHLFQECETGEMNEYSNIEQTIAPHVLTLISEWILVHTK